MRYKKIPFNTKGRDFIVGDLHGAYDSLMSLLKAANFNTAIDRLFLVGDLIDRGRQSEQCLQLLFEEWVNAVRGNHEKMYCDVVAGDSQWGSKDKYWTPIVGGAWTKPWFDKNSPELLFWSDIILDLPYVIEVEGNNEIEPFWIVHSQLMSSKYVLTPARLELYLDRMSGDDLQNMLWDRTIFRGRELEFPPNFPGPIYCGHTPIMNPGTKMHGHVNLDGGAGVSLHADTHHIEDPRLFMYCHTDGSAYETSVPQYNVDLTKV